MSEIRVRDLRFAYATGAERLRGIDLDIATGEVLVIDGASGSGKSTLLRALCGLVPHFHGGTITGSIDIAGADPITDRPASVAEHVGYLFQDPEAQIVFDIVRADVAFGPRAAGWSAAAIERSVNTALQACGIPHLANRHTAHLSGGERQRVALAGFLVREPRVILLDEPSAQLDPDGIAGLVQVLGELSEERGTTIVIADHHPQHFAPLQPRRLTMSAGMLQAGSETPSIDAPQGLRTTGGVVIEARAITCRRGERTVLSGHHFAGHEGEITLIEGPNGVGKSTLLRTLAGLNTPDEGGVFLYGDEVTDQPVEYRFPRVGFVGSSARGQMLTESVRDEIAFGMAQMGLSSSQRAVRVSAVAQELRIESLLERHPLDLSVGQREQVALAAALAPRPQVLLLDEPTRALDVRLTENLACLLRRYADAGTTVIVASHDREFADAVADRRIVLGKPVHEVTGVSA